MAVSSFFVFANLYDFDSNANYTNDNANNIKNDENYLHLHTSFTRLHTTVGSCS